MLISGLKDITIGVGHLRQQVDFYSINLGLRILARGQVPADIGRRLWQLDDDVNVVQLGRHDLPNSPRLRLLPTFDLPARPDFDVTRCGPLGILFGTQDILRTYYRLSGAGVEFHSPPTAVGPRGPKGRRHGRSLAFGRAYDGEYIVLAQPTHGPLRDGTCSPYFGVTEPLELMVVVGDIRAGSSFLQEVLGFEPMLRARRAGSAREQAMGLQAGTSFEIETLRDAERGSRISLICFGDGTPTFEARPPQRGICALRFECGDLEACIVACQEQGLGPSSPIVIDHPVLGEGRATTLMTPFGLWVELWQSV